MAVNVKSSRAKEARPEIGGIPFDFVDYVGAYERIRDLARRGVKGMVTLVNPHSIMVSREDPEFRAALLDSTLQLPDGVGVVLAARLLGIATKGRVAGPTLMEAVCERGRADGLRHYFFGGREGVAERLAERLRAAFPGIEIVGFCEPPFSDVVNAESKEVADGINASKADIVWVGLGAPKQEKWMRANRAGLAAPVLVGVGAAFDFCAGRRQRAPSLLRRCGVEWAFRLLLEPRRMWRRNWNGVRFLCQIIRDAVGARRDSR